MAYHQLYTLLSLFSPLLFSLCPNFDTLLMFCRTPSCVCCLIAEPPSPRPWDPPGSMYHLFHHLSLSSFSFLLSPLITFLLSSYLCLAPCFGSQPERMLIIFVPRVVRKLSLHLEQYPNVIPAGSKLICHAFQPP